MKKKISKWLVAVVVLIVLCGGAAGIYYGRVSKVVEFKDPLVERCVRNELGKAADEPLTVKDCASVEELLIDCDLELSYVTYYTNVSAVGPSNYVDLCDLKYLTGLKELVIDNTLNRDVLVNLEVLKACSKLERLTMNYNALASNYSGTAPMGYKYLADIIAELPELAYINVGYEVVEEHQKMIAGDNEKLVFEDDFPENAFADILLKMNGFSGNDDNETEDIEEYLKYWTYEYDENAEQGQAYRFLVNNQEEFDSFLEALPKNAEDIHIEYVGDDSLDIEALKTFKNLKTVSVYKHIGAFGLITDSHRDSAMNISNLDKLENNKELYSVCLSGVNVSCEDLKALTQVKELALYGCVLDSPEFLEQLPELGELAVCYNYCEDLQEYLLKNGDKFKGLRYLRLVSKEESDYEGIELYPDLESLVIGYANGVKDVEHISKCPNLKYLYFETTEEKLDISSIADIETLKYLYVDSTNLEKFEGVEEVVGKSGIISVVLAHTDKDGDFGEMNNWIDAAVKNDTISCFIPDKVVDDGGYLTEVNYEKLYEAGILCGVHDRMMLAYPEKYPTMEDVLEDYRN